MKKGVLLAFLAVLIQGKFYLFIYFSLILLVMQHGSP